MKTTLAILILFSPMAFAGAESAQSTGSSDYVSDTLKPAAEIQACLDQITLSKNKDQSGTPQDYSFHKVKGEQMPSNASTCQETITTLDEVRTGLQRQKADCERRIKAVNEGKSCAKLRTMTLGCRQVSEKDFCLGTVNTLINLAANETDFQNYMANAKKALDWYRDDGRKSAKGKFPAGSMQFTGYYVPAPFAAKKSEDPDPTTTFYKAPKNLVNLSKVLDPKTCEPVNADCGTDRVTGKIHKICIKNSNGTYSLPPTRAQINDGALAGNEIGQVASPKVVSDADIEGSASLQFGAAAPMDLNYVSDNGMHGFYPRQIMACAGASADERKAGWNAFLQAHSNRKLELLNYNESVIFWSPSKPMGTDGIPLTKGVSLATNIKEIPTGSVVMYSTARPGKGNPKECQTRTSMGISQDIGSAINDNHVDVFVGEGQEAFGNGQINDPGSLFVAVPKNAGTAIANCSE